ncbi:hypothetical protein ACH4TX_41650 [Streptomyces sp. NPDC021098]|uniref:hypothetical protein n=1 Tax=unclassified Streptomyces TaxID=2593676 RepID=UPI0037A8FBC8
MDTMTRQLKALVDNTPKHAPIPTPPVPVAGQRVMVTQTQAPLDEVWDGETTAATEPYEALLARIDQTNPRTPYCVWADGEEEWVHEVRVTGEPWLRYEADHAKAVAHNHFQDAETLRRERTRTSEVIRSLNHFAQVGDMPTAVRVELQKLLAQA